jgi:hypothetical protein
MHKPALCRDSRDKVIGVAKFAGDINLLGMGLRYVLKERLLFTGGNKRR